MKKSTGRTSIGRIATVTLLLVAFALSSRAEAAVGRTVGIDGVSPSGAETYRISIWAPRGPNGLEPHFALFYDSQQRSGYLGVGWSLSGISSISRCNRTVAQDGAAAPIALTTADALCLDGARLRLTGGVYGTAGSTYQTEVANFAQVTAYGSAGNGPAYFVVQAPNGARYEYGSGGGSQVLANGTSTALTWYLDKVTDAAGNTMTISYASAGLGSAVPSTVSWTPSSYGATTYNYAMQFAYGTNSAASSYEGYVGGTEVSNTQLLQSISIEYQGATVKKYALTYQPSATTGAELLTQVEECADAAQSNCLAPTHFGYQAPPVGTTSTASSAAAGAASQAVWNHDFNGDGENDLVFCAAAPSFTLEVAFASPSGGYDAPINTGISCANGSYVLYGDFLGIGQDGILAPNGGTWYYYQWNGSSFVGQSTGVAVDSGALQYTVADVDGDGRPDLIEVACNCSGGIDTAVTISVRLNTSSASAVSFSSTNAAWYSLTAPSGREITYAQLQSGSDGQSGILQSGNVRRLDFNGDGRDDLAFEYQIMYCVTFRNVCTDHYIDSANELISTGSSFTDTQIASQTTMTAPIVAFLNFNSDACTDYLSQSTIYISGCNGAPASTVTVPSSSVVGVMDWNADGRGDILVNDGGTIGVYESTGTGLGGLIATSIPYNSQNQYFGFDPTGDQLEALGVWQLEASPFDISYYPHNGMGVPPDLITSITDGYGNSVSPTYTSMLNAGVYSDYTYASPVYPYALYRAPLYVVSKVVFSDPANPPSGTYSKSYHYVGAWTNVQGRGFSNFMNVEMLDSRNSVWRLDCYENKFPFSGTHACTRLSLDQAGNQLIRYRFGNHALITLDGTANNERYFIYQNQWTDQIYQVSWSPGSGSSTGAMMESDATTFAYDNYGNATTISTTKTDRDPGSPYDGDSWTTTITNTPDVDTSSWCLNLLSESQVSYSASNGESSVTRTRQYTPDLTSCRYDEIVTEPSSATYKVTEQLGYDSFGNIDSDTVTGINMSARQSSASWGTTGQFPMTVTDALNETTTLNYDFRYGLVSSNTDPNGIITSWAYGDGFGRVTTETVFEGTSDARSTTFGYSLYSGSDPKPRMLVTEQPKDTSGNVISTITQELDMADRPYLTQNQLIDGSTDTVMQKSYDSLGRVISEEVPYRGSPVGEETLSYDVLNRPIEIQKPVSGSATATTTYQYAGRTTTITDANGNARTLIHGVNGWLRETKNATGYVITLGYDAAGGHSLTTDNEGNGPSNPLWSGIVQYGIAPFTTQASDADLGTWHYTFDALGQLTSWKDAKDQSFSAKYDALSRMTDRYEPDLYSHFTWGASATAHNIGRLQSVCTGRGASPTACTGSGYAEDETYDARGRMAERSITIPGDRAYTYTLAYNADGLPDTLTYPVSTSSYALALKFGYAYGLLKSVTDTSDSPNVALWSADTMDARGQYTQETLGNGVVVNHAFDPYRGLLQAITAGLGGGAALQNSSYLYDPVGNLSQRQDNDAGTTESVYYDSLNQLSYTVGDTNTNMTYDSMGRIATWQAYGNTKNVNDFTTPQSGCTYYANAQPHAVRQSTQGSKVTSFCYDANGNVTTDTYAGTLERSFTWTSFNQPSAITAGQVSSSYSDFYYDENHQRYEQIASYSGSTETTEYIGGLMEKMVNSSGTAYRYYIPAGNNFIVYNRWLNGANAIDYATKDNIDSTAVITDSKGALVVAEKFAALGWNENTTAQETTMADITRHEFTGQEGLDNSGLWMVDMNGRMYQPSGSYFYSPDPHIQDPENTLDYDRYAYVRDNPLTYTDPSGFDAQSKCNDDRGCASGGDGSGSSDGNAGGGSGSGNNEGSESPPMAPPLNPVKIRGFGCSWCASPNVLSLGYQYTESQSYGPAHFGSSSPGKPASQQQGSTQQAKPASPTPPPLQIISQEIGMSGGSVVSFQDNSGNTVVVTTDPEGNVTSVDIYDPSTGSVTGVDTAPIPFDEWWASQRYGAEYGAPVKSQRSN